MMKPMSKEISRDEMLVLREQGLTNKQIANKLECSYSTVMRYLGKHPSGKKREAPKPPEKPTKNLELIREVRIADFKGALCTYHVDQRNGTVELGEDKESSIVYGMISADVLDQFINELCEIRAILTRSNHS